MGDGDQAADQAGVTADQRPSAGLERHAQHTADQQRREHRQGADQGQRDAETRGIGVDQDQRADHEGDDAAKADHAETGQEGFGDHEGDTEQYQRHPGEAHGQQLQGIQRQQQADAADHAAYR
ncbi:hypothetical protein D3C71_1860190 [compost metagenome]